MTYHNTNDTRFKLCEIKGTKILVQRIAEIRIYLKNRQKRNSQFLTIQGLISRGEIDDLM